MSLSWGLGGGWYPGDADKPATADDLIPDNTQNTAAVVAHLSAARPAKSVTQLMLDHPDVLADDRTLVNDGAADNESIAPPPPTAPGKCPPGCAPDKYSLLAVST
eukprot:gene5485-982_t